MSSDPSGRKGYRRIAPSSVRVRLHIWHHKPTGSRALEVMIPLVAGAAADARLRISEGHRIHFSSATQLEGAPRRLPSTSRPRFAEARDYLGPPDALTTNPVFGAPL